MKIYSPQIIGTLDVSGNTTLNSNLNVTGSITASSAIFTNLAATSASIGYLQTITGSAVIIGEEFIILNADTPTARYAGLIVYDSGSGTPATASFEWDGLTDNWIVMEETGNTAVILTGPTGSRGSEVLPTLNVLQKGGGHHQLINSSITDNGTTVSISTPLVVTGSINATSFTGSLLGTASNATSASHALNADSAISSSFATTASFYSLAGITQNAVFSGSIRGEVNALSITSNTASLDCALDNFFTLQLVSGSNTFINPSNILPGQTINLRINTTGSATVSFPSSVKQVSGSAYVPTTTTGVDVVTFISFDATSLLLSNVKNLV